MDNKKNERRTVWLYAVMLFTGAFILLLVTAYSQVKLNKNILDYQNRIESEKKEKNDFVTNLKLSLKENQKLKDEIENLNDKLSESSDKQEAINKELKNLKNSLTPVLYAYETLILAESEYEKGDFVSCAQILMKESDLSLLGSNGLARYSLLAQKTFKKAALKLYNKGYGEYKKKRYSSAIEDFQLSYKLTKTEYFSDDCLYFMAYSEYRQGNINKAREILQTILKNFPGSSYKSSVGYLLKQWKNK